MKKFALLFALIAIFSMQVKSQVKDSSDVKTDKLSLGLGIGFDYGGFGGNLVLYPGTHFGLFVGGGYDLNGLGVNGGIKYRFISSKPNARVNPYLIAMYGYNAAIVVKNATDLNKTFYGPTVGIGLDFRQNPYRNGYWTFALLVPIRGSKVNDYIDDLKENHGVEFENELMPIGFSVGYRLVLGK
jgi:hypothetical protein